MAADLDELRGIVHRLHVHYDVQAEIDVRGRARVKVGLVVRLWGVHEKGAQALPGCPKCRALATQLMRVAEFAMRGDGMGTRIAIEPVPRALYDSRVVPGADEIALPILLTNGEGWGASSDGREERYLKQIRARLRQLGAQER